MNPLKQLSLSKTLLISFLLIVLIFLIVSYFTFINVNKLTLTSNIERHTVEVLKVLEGIIANLSDAETGQRGYLLTGELKYLEPYNAGVFLVGEEIENVKKLTEDNPNQQERIADLEILVEQKKEELQETVDLQVAGKRDEAIAIVLSDKGKDIMDNIRIVISQMQNEENELLEARQSATVGVEKKTRTIILFGSIAGLLTAVYIALVISRFIGFAIGKLRRIASEIAKGNMEINVDTTGNNELAQLSGSIDLMRGNLKDAIEEISQKAGELNKKKENLETQQLAILNILEDIEEAKSNISKEKDKINAILHSIGEGVFVIDGSYKIFIFNKAATNISGFDEKKILGKEYDKVLKFVHEKDDKSRGNFIREAMERGEVRELPMYRALVKKDKKSVAVAATAAPLKDKEGKVIGCVVVFRDIAKERTIDKAKSEFVSLASHQLRTPLSTINWYAEMLLAGDAGKITDEQKKYLDEIYKGNQRMVDLVNALLNVSRLELGTFIIEPELLDIRQLAKDAISELAAMLKKKNIKIIEKYDDLPKINLDKKLTFIIFQNLLSNAVKYSPKGSEVNISILKNERDVNIEVADKGMGIPKNQQDKIFTKLFRADNVKGKDTTGTGLGLYIIKSILDHSGGKVWFESEEGKGTTFHVDIPLQGMEKKKGTKALN